jgi:hypothetical protein
MSKATQSPQQMSFELVVASQTDAAPGWASMMSEVINRPAVQGTGEAAALALLASTESRALDAAGERAYPHIYDAAAGDSGAAMSLVAQAKQEANAAVDAWAEADLDGVSGKLAQLAATMAAAHEHTQFNESWGAVVSYIRRAALLTGAHEVTMAGLMLLPKSLNTLYAQPMLTLDDATDLIERLEAAGWRGRHEGVAGFVQALLGTSDESLQVSAQPYSMRG